MLNNYYTMSLMFLAGLMTYSVILHLNVKTLWPHQRLHWLFTGMSILLIPYLLTLTRLVNATTVREYMHFTTVGYCIYVPFLMLVPLFFAEYTGVRMPRAFAFGLYGLLVLLLTISIFNRNAAILNSVTGLEYLTMPWGERLARVRGTATIWSKLGVLSTLCISGFSFYALAVLYRLERRRTTLLMSFAMVWFLFANIAGALYRMGISDIPPLGPFGFIGMLIIIGLTLSTEVRDELEDHRKKIEENSYELTAIYDSAPMIIMILDSNGVVQKINSTVYDLLGISSDQAIGRNIGDLFQCAHVPGGADKAPSCANSVISRCLHDTIATGALYKQIEAKLHSTRDDKGAEQVFLLHSEKLDYRGKPSALMCLVDVTERRQLLDQLLQQQRLDSVGMLAGGIAHDFNNMLTPIFAFAQLIQNKSERDKNEIFEFAGFIIDGADRAKTLVQRLLSFSRKGALTLNNYDLNEIIALFTKMLKSTIRENISIHQKLCADPCFVSVDRVQLEQIILNLAVNAQDAISGVGSVTIETARVVFDDEYCMQHSGCVPGDYIKIVFTDTGCGIRSDVFDKIFDPFFTTKDVNKGTGLGLATTYGIVKQHNGHIEVSSQVGIGTSFTIYLPESAASHSAPPRIGAGKFRNRPKSRTILIAEDERLVRELVRHLLSSEGHTVLVADCPEAALELASNAGTIDLLITDVVMPQMSGVDLYQRLLETHPDLQVLFMSGYLSDNVLDGETTNFISKPFSADALLQQLTEIFRS